MPEGSSEVAAIASAGTGGWVWPERAAPVLRISDSVAAARRSGGRTLVSRNTRAAETMPTETAERRERALSNTTCGSAKAGAQTMMMV